MSGKVILGIRERPHFVGSLAAHLDGSTRPATAMDAAACRARRGREPVEALLPDGSAAVRAVLHQHRENRRRGRQPNEIVDLMLAGPPPWEQARDADGNLVGEAPWPAERVDAWRDAALAWGVRIFGPESTMLGGWLHADETSPHVHLAGVPIQDGRISWKALKTTFASDFLGRKSVHHRFIYSAMRQSYHEEVGRRFGLARGEVRVFDEAGQKAEPIDRAKAAEHRARVAEAAAKEADERTRVAEAAAATARAELEAGSRGRMSGRRRQAGRELIEAREAAERDRDQALDRARQADEAREAAELQAAKLRRHVAELDGHVAAIDARVAAVDARARDWADFDGLLSDFREKRKAGVFDAPAPAPAPRQAAKAPRPAAGSAPARRSGFGPGE